MKCVLISCFNAYDQRIRPIETFLRGKGYDCEYITSDFNHRDVVRQTNLQAFRQDKLQ
jgi:hypothetical protein